jgi:hypothetical protein
LSWSSKLIGLSRNGIWISISPEIFERCKYLSFENGGRKHTTTPKFTRKEQKDGTIRNSNTRNSNSRVKLFDFGKLKSKWVGPFNVIDTSSHGAISLQDDSGNIFKVNNHLLKIDFELEKNEEVDVIEFLNISD